VDICVKSLLRTSTGVRTVGAMLMTGRAKRMLACAMACTSRSLASGLANLDSKEISKARKDESAPKRQHGTARLFRPLKTIRGRNPT